MNSVYLPVYIAKSLDDLLVHVSTSQHNVVYNYIAHIVNEAQTGDVMENRMVVLSIINSVKNYRSDIVNELTTFIEMIELEKQLKWNEYPETKPHEHDDLWSALENNPTTFSETDIKDIVAEITGANDEIDWWWVLELVSGEFLLLSGWCDYTGWDCQSAVTEHTRGTDVNEVILTAPVTEELTQRTIREVLQNQVDKTIPFGVYERTEFEDGNILDVTPNSLMNTEFTVPAVVAHIARLEQQITLGLETLVKPSGLIKKIELEARLHKLATARMEWLILRVKMESRDET